LSLCELGSNIELYEPPKAYCAEMRAWAKVVLNLPSSLPKTDGQEKPCPVER